MQEVVVVVQRELCKQMVGGEDQQQLRTQVKCMHTRDATHNG
jgi:hypothetical protein